MDRGRGIVKVERRINLYQIHACLVIGIQGSNVPPVISFVVTKRKGEYLPALDETRQNVSAKV
jgi:hypothetical protein